MISAFTNLLNLAGWGNKFDFLRNTIFIRNFHDYTLSVGEFVVIMAVCPTPVTFLFFQTPFTRSIGLLHEHGNGHRTNPSWYRSNETCGFRYFIIPTSITTAPSLTKSLVTKCPRPIATTKISASFVISDK